MKHSEKTKRKMRLNHVDVSGDKNPMFGKKHSDDVKEKIANSRKGRVWIFDPLTGVQRAVDKDSLDQYLARGWRRGRVKYQKEPTYLLSF